MRARDSGPLTPFCRSADEARCAQRTEYLCDIATLQERALAAIHSVISSRHGITGVAHEAPVPLRQHLPRHQSGAPLPLTVLYLFGAYASQWGCCAVVGNGLLRRTVVFTGCPVLEWAASDIRQLKDLSRKRPSAEERI